METIGDRIKSKRKELGLTQLELAEKLNVTDRAVSKWEQGDGDPSISVLRTLATILNVTLDYLMTGKIQEDVISLDDMDKQKRIDYLIKKDDAINFEKYGYLNKKSSRDDVSIFNQEINFSKIILTSLNKEVWNKLFENNAKNIINKAFDKFVEYNNKGISAAVLVVDFMENFVRYAVDSDRVDILECIGARFFKVGPAYVGRFGKKEIPLLGQRETYYLPLYIVGRLEDYERELVSFGISLELLKYIVSKEQDSPNCFAYITSTDYKIEPPTECRNYVNKKGFIYTSYDAELLNVLIELNKFDKVENIINTYSSLLNEIEFDEDFEKIINTFAIRQGMVLGRVFTFSLNQIYACIDKNRVELAVKMIEHNKSVVNKYSKSSSSCSGLIRNIPILTNADVERRMNMNKTDLSLDKKLLLECVNDHIIIPKKLKAVKNLEFVRNVLDNNAYHYYEYVYDCLKNNKQKELFKFFVDNELNSLACDLMNGDSKSILSRTFGYLKYDPSNAQNYGNDYSKNLRLIKKQNLIDFEALTETDINLVKVVSIDKYGNECIKTEHCYKYIFQNEFKKKYGDLNQYTGLLENNPIIEHIKDLKEKIYNYVKDCIETEKKAENDKAEKAKIAKGLTKECFQDLLDKNETELFIIKLFSLLDAILRFDYKYEQEDFSGRMKAYFDMLEKYLPKSSDIDDGWGYMVLDTKYEENTVKPAREKFEEESNLLNRLRMLRNNIAHSETKPVKELSLSELKKCMDIVCGMNKEEE